MSERRRLPDTRRGFTKKLSVTHVHLVGQSTTEVLLALKQLVAVVDLKVEPVNAAKVVERARSVLAKYSKEQLVSTKLYITTGCYDDGSVGEVFLKADRMGSTISGLLDALSMCLSIGLQAGIPLIWFTGKLKSMRFEPAGPTTDPLMPRVTSLMDGLARWLETQSTEKEETPCSE